MKQNFHRRLELLVRSALQYHNMYITSPLYQGRTVQSGFRTSLMLPFFSLCELRFFKDRDLSLPDVVKPLVDVDFVTIATDSLTQCLQPLVTVSSFKSVKFSVCLSSFFCYCFCLPLSRPSQTSLFSSLAPHDLVSVRMSRAVIHKPQPSSRDDHTRSAGGSFSI